jgi:hypothetical protein
MDTDADQKALSSTIFKGPKRKRLVKVSVQNCILPVNASPLLCSDFVNCFHAD